VLVSEYSPGTPALPHQFPERNRLIAALARGTLVVEAALQSGSLITARLATEMGREVFAIPGSIHSPQSKGCHALIKQGAKLVESAADILDELVGGQLPSPQAPVKPQLEGAHPNQMADENPGTEEDAGGSTSNPLLDALGWAPMALDELCARTGVGAATLSAQLLELELLGSVRRLPGHRYERLRRG
jgi:DNA processing protein